MTAIKHRAQQALHHVRNHEWDLLCALLSKWIVKLCSVAGNSFAKCSFALFSMFMCLMLDSCCILHSSINSFIWKLCANSLHLSCVAHYLWCGVACKMVLRKCRKGQFGRDDCMRNCCRCCSWQHIRKGMWTMRCCYEWTFVKTRSNKAAQRCPYNDFSNLVP